MGTALQLTMPKDPKNAPESDDDLEIGEVEATQDATAKEHAKAVKKAGKEEELSASLQNNQSAAVAADTADVKQIVNKTNETNAKAEKAKETGKKAESDMPCCSKCVLL